MTIHNLKSAFAKATFGIFLGVAILGSGSLVPFAVAQDHRHSSVTGYFGLDDEGFPIPDRRGIMLVFDGAIAPETVSVNTFKVSLEDGSFAEVIETRVDGPYVFLKLKSELVSDATPILGISEGEEVEDLAGNSTNRRKFGFVQIKDGIAPRLTIELSGGSGSGSGDESPNRLTKDTIDIRITSDEPLQGAPSIVVVCDDLAWQESDGTKEIEHDIDDFIANRNGPFARRPQEASGTTYTCGYDVDDDGEDDVFELTVDIAISRPGEVWEYTWHNGTGDRTRLLDDELVVVAYGRDRSHYDRYRERVSNWSTAQGSFGLDTVFDSKNPLEEIVVIPNPGSNTGEPRPFVLLQFPEAASVKLTSVVFDGTEIVDEIISLEDNRFLYWPEGMSIGKHTVRVEASDAAGNYADFQFSFEAVEPEQFVLELYPGWNAISFPTRPVDTYIEAVFTEQSIETVIGWSEGRWRLAVQRDGPWEYNLQYEALGSISESYGYWVKSSSYVQQRVALVIGSYDPVPYGPIMSAPPTQPGWNFVAVIDRERDQSEDHFGDALRDVYLNPIFADEYLGDYEVAYTWDPIHGRFDRLLPDDPMIIGDGVWVYYEMIAP